MHVHGCSRHLLAIEMVRVALCESSTIGPTPLSWLEPRARSSYSGSCGRTKGHASYGIIASVCVSMSDKEWGLESVVET